MPGEYCWFRLLCKNPKQGTFAGDTAHRRNTPARHCISPTLRTFDWRRQIADLDIFFM
jgi:hypothetical protein